MKKIVFAILILAVHCVWGDDLDGLFEQSPGDITAQVSVAPPPPPGPTVKVSGSTSFQAGLLVGQADWGSPLSGSGVYTMQGSMSFDARPDSRIRAWAVFNTSSTGVSFSVPAVSEFFFDYTLADSVVFRVGKQSLGWGQGRLFNPANIVNDFAQGISFKVFTPLFGQSLTFVSLARDIADPAKPSWRELIYAAQFSGDLGPFGWGFAGRTRPDPALTWTDRRVSGFLKTVVAGVDVFAEALWSSGQWQELFGVYWEQSDAALKLQAESTDTRLGLAMKTTFGPIKPALQWTHIYSDGSGSVVGGIDWPVDGLTTVTLGFPMTYGALTGLGMAENPDPAKRRWAMGIKLSLDANF